MYNFCSLSIKSEVTWLSLEKLKLKAKTKVPVVHKHLISPSARTPRKVLPSQHLHGTDRAVGSPTVQPLGVRDL